MKAVSPTRLHELIHVFGSKRVLVVGDFFLDLYLLIDPERTEPSLETGLPAYQVCSRRLSPGAAGTVAKNLSYLGAEVHALGFTGQDGNGYDLRCALEGLGIKTDYLFETSTRMTPTYVKPMLCHKDKTEEEMSRQDIKNFTPTSGDIQGMIINSLNELAPKMDAVLVLDQVTEEDCGAITSPVREAIGLLGEKRACPVIYADSRANIHLFRNVIVKCNEHEITRGVAGDRIFADNARLLCEKTQRPVFVTRGRSGVFIQSNDGDTYNVPGVHVEGSIDICGAGDAVSSALVLGLASGATLSEAAVLGNLSASIAITQLGTTGHATPDDLHAAIRKHYEIPLN